MSDTKPRRAAREPARSEDPSADAIADAAASVIEENMTHEPEPASMIVAAQSAPVEPTRPTAGAPGGTPSGMSPKAVLGATAEDSWAALAEAQSALARGFEKAAFEMTGMSRSGMAATADAAVALLGARTFAEAIEINAGLARRGVDAMLEGAARLSEIGAQAAADASRPLIARFARNWSALGGG